VCFVVGYELMLACVVLVFCSMWRQFSSRLHGMDRYVGCLVFIVDMIDGW
jgi:hypothetical protein